VHERRRRSGRLGLPARRILRSFGYAFEGIVAIIRTQPNFSVHLAAAVVALTLAAILEFSAGEVAILILTISAVLAAEAFNTALEALSDLVSPTLHPLVKRAKDVSAAGVLISAFGALFVGILLFLPRLLRLL
jgi:diacylglycerol kinase (ATP)